jgi:hypothetical protein
MRRSNRPSSSLRVVPVDYYSDRVEGQRARENEEITPAVWGGIVSLVERGVACAWFGKDFPLECDDGDAVCGCDLRAFGLALAAEIPDLDWPFNERVLPPTLAALDLLEFAYRHASAPRQRSYHGYFGHHHLTFTVAAGRSEMRERINRLLALAVGWHKSLMRMAASSIWPRQWWKSNSPRTCRLRATRSSMSCCGRRREVPQP